MKRSRRLQRTLFGIASMHQDGDAPRQVIAQVDQICHFRLHGCGIDRNPRTAKHGPEPASPEAGYTCDDNFIWRHISARSGRATPSFVLQFRCLWQLMEHIAPSNANSLFVPLHVNHSQNEDRDESTSKPASVVFFSSNFEGAQKTSVYPGVNWFCLHS